jgi:primase-like protein/uncharacterized protein DUF3987
MAEREAAKGVDFDAITDIRLSWRSNGYPPVPITHPDVNMPSAGKAPRILNWQTIFPNASAEDIRLYTHRYADHTNTGICCGLIVGVDNDALDPAIAALLDECRLRILGPTPLCRVGRAPRVLFVYRGETPIEKLQTPKFYPDENIDKDNKAAVEILGLGQQFVGHGIHPVTRCDYTWTGSSPLDIPAAELPIVTPERLCQYTAECEQIFRAAGYKTEAEIKAVKVREQPGHDAAGSGRYEAPTYEKVEDALNHLPNNVDRDTYIDVAFSVYAGLGEAGWPLFLGWARRWSGYDEKDTISDWRSAKKVRFITIGTLFRLALDAGWMPQNQRQDDHHSSAQSRETRHTERERPWPVLDDAALYGLAGEIVNQIKPQTEADPVGILVQLLTSFGSLIGNSAYYPVESSRHHANLFMILVGKSSKGRKGTGAERVRDIVRDADALWTLDRCVSGLSSGEGIINAVRDEVKKWNSKENCEELVDPGIADKRLMITEEEFAGTLSVMERPGNTLNPILRNAWNGGLRLQTLTKAAGQTATKPHISVVGHITEDETRRRLTRTDIANGFANRFLWLLVKRWQLLPHGGYLDDVVRADLARRFKEAVEFGKRVGRIGMARDAYDAWTEIYPALSAERPGLFGSVTARAEAQTIRLALIYTLLDRKLAIEKVHLEAALAVWEYCEQSAARIFGDAIGDPVADEILQALRVTPEGLSRTRLRDLFGRHAEGDKISAALKVLLTTGKARCENKLTGGRPIEMWFAVVGGGK